MTERRNGLENHQHHHIKGSKSQRSGRIYGTLNPDTTPKDVLNHLLNPNIYGDYRFSPMASGYGRSLRRPIKLPKSP